MLAAKDPGSSDGDSDSGHVSFPNRSLFELFTLAASAFDFTLLTTVDGRGEVTA